MIEHTHVGIEILRQNVFRHMCQPISQLLKQVSQTLVWTADPV